MDDLSGTVCKSVMRKTDKLLLRTLQIICRLNTPKSPLRMKTLSADLDINIGASQTIFNHHGEKF